ncbi:MAG: alpha/beta hydrolase [Acidobacteria bacterium]|nr:alpha/beta hydrolase [Acidobacteriota bacterium]MBI3663156.1 alpha/beta hydrolase [Acidobacteriota bacterium]
MNSRQLLKAAISVVLFSVVLLVPAAFPADKNAASSAAALPGTKSGFVTTADGVKIHYLHAGQKLGFIQQDGKTVKGTAWPSPAILFVPGWTMPAWIWEHQISHFSKTHRVVAIDPRGQGESSKPTDGYYPAARARDIKAVMDQLRLAPVVLVGWSMGVGEVVSYVDQFGTKDLAGVMLVDGIAGADPNPQMMSALMAFAGNFLKEREKFTEGFVRSMYKKPQTEPYIQKVIAASKQTLTTAGVALFVGAFTTDNRPALAKIDKPALICIAPGGPWDALYDDMQKRTPGSRLEKFDGAGHALFVDDAAKFNALLDDFITRIRKP